MKRILFGFLVLALLLAGVSAAAPQAKAETLPGIDNCDLVLDASGQGICNACNAVVSWIAIGQIDEPLVLTGEGHYYLANDITYTGTANAAIQYPYSRDYARKTTCLHLNGHNLISENERAIFAGNYLNVLGNGIVSGNYVKNNRGATVEVNSSVGRLNLYGGTYIKAAANTVNPILCVNNAGGMVNLYDGAVIDGTGLTTETNPACVQINGKVETETAGAITGVLNIYGGVIQNGTNSTGYGGNIRMVNNAVLNMYGGTVTGGKAPAQYGGNIYSNAGDVNILGGTISDGLARLGGNVAINGQALTIQNATIENGVADITTTGSASHGGNVSVDRGTLYIGEGAVIRDGSAPRGHAGNVRCYNTVLTMDGGTISGGTSKNANGNIWVYSDLTDGENPVMMNAYFNGGESVTADGAKAGNGLQIANQIQAFIGGDFTVTDPAGATAAGVTLHSTAKLRLVDGWSGKMNVKFATKYAAGAVIPTDVAQIVTLDDTLTATPCGTITGTITQFNGEKRLLEATASGTFAVPASVEDYLTWSISNGKATITDCDEAASGDIIIPDTIEGHPVTQIGQHAFAGCNNLCSVTIPDSVTQISSYAFQNCGKIANIYVGKGLARIGEYVFSSCDSLEGIWISESNDAYCSDDKGVLYNKTKTTLIRVPRGKVGNYTIPDGVITIEDDGFSGCDRLTSVTFSDSVTTIGENTFTGCSNLASVFLGNGVKTIESEAFYECDGLEAIVIPDSVTSIGTHAFSWCEKLVSVTLGNSTPTLERFAFSGCYNLTGIWVSEDNTLYSNDDRGVLFNKDKTTVLHAPGGITGSYIIPDSVTLIDDGAFSWCRKLTTVVIGKGVTKINYYGFSECSSLRNVIMYDSVSLIESIAFEFCSIGEVYYSGSKEQWDAIPIGGNNEPLTKANIHFDTVISNISVTSKPDKTTYFIGEELKTSGMVLNVELSDGSAYTVSNGFTTKRFDSKTPGKKTVYVFYDECFTTFDVEVVETVSGTCGNNVTWNLNYEGVMRIAGSGDMYYVNYWNTLWDSCIKEVIIEDGVTSIGGYSFGDCGNLTYVTIGNRVTNIGDGAFQNCPNLVSVTVGSNVTTVGAGAFENCTGLTGITIPDGVTEIGDSAFANCVNLSKVTIGENVAAIGKAAFSGCEKLAQISIPASVETIGDSAFQGCASLEAIRVNTQNPNYRSDGAGVLYNKNGYKLLQAPAALSGEYRICTDTNEIALNAFSDCSRMTGLVIPENVSVVGNSAFANCTGLKDVYYTGSQELWGEMIVGGNNDAITKASVQFGAVTPIVGDVDGWLGITEDDAIYVLEHVLMPDLFPVEQTADYDGNGQVNEDDALYLLMAVLLPEYYPL